MSGFGVGRSPLAGVVVPAHNEERVVARTLQCLLRDAEPGEFRVVVVCNGCTDSTYEIVRALEHDDVAVIRTPEASKARALNAGDAQIDVFPRLYLDADVELDTQSARSMGLALGELDCVVATPEYLVEGATWWARHYWREWRRRNPAPSSGTGCFGLSRSGHAVIGFFPDLLGDDQYVAAKLAPHSVRSARTRVRLARSLPAVLRRRVRIERGNKQVSATVDRRPLGGSGDRGPERSIASADPIGLVIVLGVHGIARAWARLRPAGGWVQDASTREMREARNR